ncbi:MAG TPA: SDR family oxidoreductase [Terriglobales bacterium]|nr:SDR family oxidoreductase [Terriglobales bacterium]
MAGKCALVTGGARRIGKEIALTLARAGADVAFTYLKSGKDAEQTNAALAKSGVRTFSIRCDLRDVKSIEPCAGEAIAKLGRLDLLINNAGAYETVSFEEIMPEQWDAMFDVNVRAAFFMSQACAKELRAHKGRIVNIGSLGGIRPWATHAHYCASKAALHMLTQSAAKALAPEIKVNCIAPGMIDQGESARGSEVLENFAVKTPVQRNGTAADVAQSVLFLATCPDFITGQILAVDGGLGLV